MKRFQHNYFLLSLIVWSCGSLQSAIPKHFRKDIELHKGHVVDVAVIGGGPAGCAAAFGIGHRQRSVIIFAGDKPGGQAMGSHLIDNLPGTVPVSGPLFYQQLQQRLQEVGVSQIDYDPIVSIEMRHDADITYFILQTQTGERWLAFGIVIATGGEDKRLHVDGESEYWDKSVFTCVSCASLRARRSKNLYVVGGGDASIDMLLDLLDLVPQCTLLVRSEAMRAAPSLQKRIMHDPRVTICYKRMIKRMQGDDEQLQELVLVDEDGRETIVSADCVFLAIGKIPATAWLVPLRASGFDIMLDDAGYIKVDAVGRTNIPQVYAVGDVVFPDHGDHQIDLGMALARVRTARALIVDISRQGIFTPLFQQEIAPYYYKKEQMLQD